jgi:hypothetical protein
LLTFHLSIIILPLLPGDHLGIRAVWRISEELLSRRALHSSLAW